MVLRVVTQKLIALHLQQELEHVELETCWRGPAFSPMFLEVLVVLRAWAAAV
jgi:hypothetical protein